jgi:hypothetical protein
MVHEPANSVRVLWSPLEVLTGGKPSYVYKQKTYREDIQPPVTIGLRLVPHLATC